MVRFLYCEFVIMFLVLQWYGLERLFERLDVLSDYTDRFLSSTPPTVHLDILFCILTLFVTPFGSIVLNK